MATPLATITVINGVPTLVFAGVARTPVRLATTGNHGLSGLAAVDGVTPLAGDRVLVWQQTTASQNGVYDAAAGAWTRSKDFDDASADYLFAGVEFYVQEGDANGQTKFVLTTTGAITVGSTSLSFTGGTPLLRSDVSGTEVRASAALTASYVATSNSDVRDFREVDWVIYVTNKGTGPITRIDVQVQASDKTSPADADFATVQAEAVSAGVSTMSDYTLQKDITSLVAPFTIVVRAPVTGRFMRVRIQAGAGTPTSSAVSINAYRRI